MMNSRPGEFTRCAVWIVALGLAMAACSGSPDTATTEGDSDTTEGEDVAVTTTTPQSPDAENVTTTASQGDTASPSAGAVNAGTVTIGDTTWEFDATPGTITQCDPDFFGAFWVIGETPDGDGVTILLPPPNDPNFEDPPSVRVKVNDGGADFTADPSLVETSNYDTVISAGDSQVDSYSVEGATASGTATFVDEQQIFAALGGTEGDPEPLRGSFEVTCAEE